MNASDQPAPAAAIRVVVADDQAAVREGLVALLGLLPGIEVVAAAADGSSALAAVAAAAPDVVLMDLRMPGLDGVAAIQQVTQAHPDVAVVVLTSYAQNEMVLAALAAGARGFLTKSAGRHEIAQAIQAAAAGLSPMDSRVQAQLIAAARLGQIPAELPDGLTRREAETLTLVAAGLGNAEIAQRLQVSLATVKTHINRIFAKARVCDRPAAIEYARRYNLSS